jgi:hypothetical protein
VVENLYFSAIIENQIQMFFLKPLKNLYSIASIILIVSALFYYHFSIVSFPFQLEYREGAPLITTSILASGGNPYQLDSLPQHLNNYGIFYSLLCAPISKIFGNTFYLHRLISGIFILLTCVVVFLYSKRTKKTFHTQILLILLLYASLLFNQTPLSRPDSLGMFLFVLSLYLTDKFNYSFPILLLTTILGILAFYTKTFYLLTFPYISFYLFLFDSKKKGILFGVLSFSALIISLVIVEWVVMPGYTYNCFFNLMNATKFSIEHIVFQSKFYFISNFAALFILIVVVILLLKNKFNAILIKIYSLKINISSVNKPLLNVKMPSEFVYLFLSVTIVILKLAGHTGAYMTYYYQLLSPFILLSTIWILNKFEFDRKYFGLLLVSNILIFIFIILPPIKLNSVIKSDWGKINSIVEQNDIILNSPFIVSCLINHNKKIFDSGHSIYFVFSRTPKIFSSIKPLRNTDLQINNRIIKFKSELSDLITSKKADIIFYPNELYKYIPDSVVFQNYYIADSVRIYCPQPLIQETTVLKILKRKK